MSYPPFDPAAILAILGAVRLGEVVPAQVATLGRLRRGDRHHSYVSFDDGGGEWSLRLRDARLVTAPRPQRSRPPVHAPAKRPARRTDPLARLDLAVRSDSLASLTAVYDAIVSLLRARHGEPTSAPPDDDALWAAPAVQDDPRDPLYFPDLRSMSWRALPDEVSIRLGRQSYDAGAVSVRLERGLPVAAKAARK